MSPRILKGSDGVFSAYQAGKWAEYRDEWMRLARNRREDPDGRARAVANARRANCRFLEFVRELPAVKP